MRTGGRICLLFCLFSISRAALALDCGSIEGSGTPVNYAVIRVSDHDGVVRYEAVPKANLKERKEELILAYGAAIKVYKLKKKGLPLDEVSILLKRPSRPRMIVLGTGFSKEKAAAKADKLQKEYKESREKNSVGLFTGD
ncbi:MAG: hypothetical protein GXP25_11655 [Planctomycetes bacterium]|nr:hypothetical protein [Planctomycetota bacterium]